jgi:hypothetical protein
VTVSIAAETSGMFSLIVRVKRVSVLAAVGSTDDAWGTSRTSSKVNASLIGIAELLKVLPAGERLKKGGACLRIASGAAIPP